MGEDELFSQAELVEMFDPKRLSKPPAAFDAKKLAWVNNHYIKEMNLDELTDMCLPFLVKAGRVEENPAADKKAWVKKVVALYQPQMSFAAEIVELSGLFFGEHPELEEEGKTIMAQETTPVVLQAFKGQLESLTDFTPENILASIKAVQKETGIKGKNLFMPIRIATSGQMHGPDLPNTIEIMGQEATIANLDKALA